MKIPDQMLHNFMSEIICYDKIARFDKKIKKGWKTPPNVFDS